MNRDESAGEVKTLVRALERGIPEGPAAIHFCPWPGCDDLWESEASCVHALALAARDRVVAATAAETALREAADDPQTVERCAREAFWTDDMGGHHKPGSSPHTWENIPEVGRENYRTLIRAVLRAAAAHPDEEYQP